MFRFSMDESFLSFFLEATCWPNNLFRSCYKYSIWCANPTACAISINVNLGQRQENLKKDKNSVAILGPLGTIKSNKFIGQLFVCCLSCVLVLCPCAPSGIFFLDKLFALHLFLQPPMYMLIYT